EVPSFPGATSVCLSAQVVIVVYTLPTGVLPVAISVVQSVPHTYYLITTPKTWTDAKTYCEETYTDLAVVLSYRDWIKFHLTVQSKDLSTDAWVGLFNDIKGWRWSFKNITLAETFWYPGQPDNQGGHQSCGSIDTSGYWWDNVCTTLMPFLCFNGESVFLCASYKTPRLDLHGFYKTLAIW
uniref:C-type lectin domain-containing protein n=1 Tax=Electrophorus electricus TaxID=8005 RepID=A0AAY5EXV5_ELEEL